MSFKAHRHEYTRNATHPQGRDSHPSHSRVGRHFLAHPLLTSPAFTIAPMTPSAHTTPSTPTACSLSVGRGLWVRARPRTCCTGVAISSHLAADRRHIATWHQAVNLYRSWPKNLRAARHCSGNPPDLLSKTLLMTTGCRKRKPLRNQVMTNPMLTIAKNFNFVPLNGAIRFRKLAEETRQAGNPC